MSPITQTLNVLVVVLFSLLVPHSVFAQAGSEVRGVLKSKEDQEPIPFANIGLQNSSDSIVMMSTSNFDGEFAFLNVPNGSYSLKVSSMGFKPLISAVFSVSNGQPVTLETLELQSLLNKLEEVNVVAEKAMIQQGVGKTILNVGEQIANSGEAATELIQYLPSASTDEENKVLVRGMPATILVDGVNSDLDNPLESIPADAIEKIEMITNPSAKYSSQNGSAIINIVLKKGKKKGANGRVNVAYGSPERYQGGANLILQRNKWTSYSRANYSQYTDEFINTSVRDKHTETENSVLYNDTEIDRFSKNIDLRQGVKYQFNKKTSLRIDGSYRQNNSENDAFQVTEKIKEDIKAGYNTNETESESDRTYYKATANFKKEFDAFSNLSLVGVYERQENKSPYERLTSYYYPETMEKKSNYMLQTRTNPETIESKRLKFDYEKGLSKHAKVETGFLIINRNSEVESDLLKIKYNVEDNGLTPTVDSTKMYQFSVNELLPSAYLVGSFEKGKWGMSAGVRYEFARMESGSPAENTVVSNDFHNFLPSFLLERKIGKKLKLGVSATKRTKQPNYRQLNPVEVYNGTYSKTSGNPNLQPQKITNLEFNANQSTQAGSVNASLFFKGFDDMITRTQEYVVEEGEEILSRSFSNIGQVDQLGIDFNVSQRFFESLKVKANFVGLYQDIETVQNGNPIAFEDFSFTSKLILNQKFENGFRWQVTSIYNSARKTVTGENLEYYYTNVGIGKSIFNKKANIAFTVYDIFDTQKRERIDTSSIDYVQHNSTKNITQRFLIAFNYRFNTEKK